MLTKTICHILPLYTLVPLHSLNRLICVVHQADDVRQVHFINLTLAHLAPERITKFSTAHGTL
jgi:hypothetical protein